MSGGYQHLETDPFRELGNSIQDVQRRLAELERPTGTQIYDSIRKLRELVDSFPAQLAALSASGQTWQGPVTTTGTVTANTGVYSTGVYNALVSSGAYKAQYINVSGQMGYVPSSRQFKQDIATAPDASEAMLAMRIVTFRYINAVADHGDEAAVEWGVIAEEMHDLGLTWLVDYDEEGRPEGVKYERLVLATVPVIQDHELRLRAIEAGDAQAEL